MDRQYNIGVIGATGITGQKIVQALCVRGYSVLIGGRDHKALQRMSSVFGDACVAQPVDLTSRESLLDFLQRVPVVIQCVGPFVRWGLPIVDAAIEAKTHVVDISGEQAYALACMQNFHTLALDAGVCIVNGAAVEGGVADALATQICKNRKLRPRNITVLTKMRGVLPSPASIASFAGVLHGPMWDLRGGILQEKEFGYRQERCRGPEGKRRRGLWIPGIETILISRHLPARNVGSFFDVSGFPRVLLAKFAARLLHDSPERVIEILAKLMPRWLPVGAPSFSITVTVEGDLETTPGKCASRSETLVGLDPYVATARIAMTVAEHLCQKGEAESHGIVSPAMVVSAEALVAAALS